MLKKKSEEAESLLDPPGLGEGKTAASSLCSPDMGDFDDGWDKSIFNRFRKIVYEKSGISLGPGKTALVSARVSKRMRALNIEEPRAYLRYLMNDTSGDELVQLLDVISTNVTSFFREPDHFEFLAEIVQDWLRGGLRSLRIWSAAASTGEEPYSIAMTLLEQSAAADVDLRILATDISTRVLRASREGRYEMAQVEAVPQALRAKYFDRLNENGSVVFSARVNLKSLITFRRLNLSRPPFAMKGPFDVIFCRNVMIYFDDSVRQRLVDEMHRLLRNGGFLLVGHSESLVGISSDFRMVKPAVYVKEDR
jgi:chemotaxis protein methyltransferase CheR